MTDDQLKRARTEFINGRSDKLRLGGYGGTVTLAIARTGVRISVTQPKRKARTLTPNSRTNRQKAVEIAEKYHGRIQKRGSARAPTTPPQAPAPGQAALITPRDVWLRYLRIRLPGVPEDEVLGWGRKQLREYRSRLTPGSKVKATTVSNLYAAVLAARRLSEDGAAPLDADIESIQTDDLENWVSAELAAGASLHTVKTYTSRFRTAVREFAKKKPLDWGNRHDPTVDMDEISTESVRPEEIGEERAARVLAALRERGSWQAVATGMVADTTGMRVGSFSADRDEIHEDAPPLTANDFRWRDGELEVTWRGDVQKGRGYKRGDVTLTATRRLELFYRWVTRFHPNPAGPEHPLIWNPDDPTKAESYSRLTKEFDAAWVQAFGEPKPAGLAWHGFCRTTITTIADELGVLAAADFTGRSVKVVERVYRRARRGRQRETAARLDELRRDRGS